MEIYVLCGLKRASLFVIVLAVAGKIAAADPLYTVTDLGSASQPSSGVTFSTDANGQQIATINGSASIPFPQAPLSPAPASGPSMQILANTLYPPIMQETTGSVSAYNNNGIVAGIISLGPGVGENPDIYYARMNSNGAYQNLGQQINPPSPVYLLAPAGYGPPGPIYVNNLNQIAYMVDRAEPYLFNINNSLTYQINNLIPPSVSPTGQTLSWNVDQLLGLDDKGDILVQANLVDDSQSPPYPEEYLLLTPPGVSSPVLTPEPTTLAFWAMAISGAGMMRAARRFVRSRPSSRRIPFLLDSFRGTKAMVGSDVSQAVAQGP